DGTYGIVLRWALRHKFVVIVLTVLTIGATVPIAKVMGVSLIPRDDQSEYEVSITTPAGYTLARSDTLCAELEAKLKKLPGTVHIFSTIGQVGSGRVVKGQGDVTLGTIYVRMKDLAERSYTQFDVQQQARDMLKDYPDLRASVNDVSAFQGGRRPQTFQVILSGPDIEQLAKYSHELIEGKDDHPGLKAKGGIVDLDTTLSLQKPEMRVAIDREAASDLGIPVASIADSLRILVGGMPITTFKERDEQYDVWLRAQPSDRASTNNLYEMNIPSPKVGLARLASVARLSEALGPTEIERYNRQRIVTVLGNPDTIPLGEAVSRADAILKDMDLPPLYSFTYTGQAKTLAETGYFLAVAFGLSVLFMYLILCAQFESWTQPVSILMALPVTVPFGLLSLVFFRTPMDLYGMFGLFMLVGIVKKNGILQVDATNQLRARGVPKLQAILEANHTRFRPILMTTVMLVAAMIPIALGQGPGAGARASMAKVIIGGQMLSLVLALVVTPGFYALLDSWVAFLRRMGVRLSVEPHRPHKPQRVPTEPREKEKVA
ncbi:MAG TPA: efflux RND transporter permease subunit, partial [Isosphaeraceae bacterium]|nr:efflux RND transporter permease subunit [Isosphaeraceae bacterium]